MHTTPAPKPAAPRIAKSTIPLLSTIASFSPERTTAREQSLVNDQWCGDDE